ncbi:hypothetical protein CVM49_01780 [Staphylococcus pseudintermedius]|nr:hypothetical protein [Staphylococcus pseudintermedius]EGQ1719432.1 hypothetical protein [Staphylococcus pseudintermedius]EGQ1726858.1 hypothetical protein [Staphylococcus pseudintermedius]EGQ1746093.1 hypothetical protein [Staphylococcus pseudintermedius]EGQ2938492.1 hypothetical protein [Staphylococcus pseudintermedius]
MPFSESVGGFSGSADPSRVSPRFTIWGMVFGMKKQGSEMLRVFRETFHLKIKWRYLLAFFFTLHGGGGEG